MAILSGLGGVLFFYVKRFNSRLEDLDKDKATKHEVRELISLNLTPIEVELREIKEETGLDVRIGNAFHIDEWDPVVRGEQWQIIGTYIECFSDSPEIKLSKDHDKYEWINPEDYKNYELIGKTAKAFESYLRTN